jgi:tetratricopeptide (TPR) repeat protein
MNNKLKIKQYTLSPQDDLPQDISDPAELIKKITRKMTINATVTNVNNLFLWFELVEKTLERYKEYDDKLIIDLQYNLARTIFEKLDYNRAKVIMEDIIKKCSEIKYKNKRKLSDYYWFLAVVLKNIGDYKDAKENIEIAISLVKNEHFSHCTYAEILFELGENKEAKDNYKKALEICIKKKGKEHQQTAIIYSNYGWFFIFLRKYDKAISYLNKAYRIFKKNNGEENLYTVRFLADISLIDFNKREYDGAFENMNKVFLILKKIKGDDDTETERCKVNCGKMLVMLKRYDEVVNYLSDPFAIVSGKEEIFLLLDYNKDIMIAPEIIISKKGASVKKLIKIAESKNISITKNHILAKGMMKDCYQFEPVTLPYYERLAKILAKIQENRV